MFSNDYYLDSAGNSLITEKGIAAADPCGRFAVHAGSGFCAGSFAAKAFCVCRCGKVAKSVFRSGNIGYDLVGSGNKNNVFRSEDDRCNAGSGAVNVINFAVFGNCICTCKEKIRKKCFSSCGFNFLCGNNVGIAVIVISVFKKFDDSGFVKSS